MSQWKRWVPTNIHLDQGCCNKYAMIKYIICQCGYYSTNCMNLVSKLGWFGGMISHKHMKGTPCQWVLPIHFLILNKTNTMPLEFTNVEIVDMETHNKLVL